MRPDLHIIRTVENIDDARLRPSLRTRTRRSPLRACTVCGRPSAGSRCALHRDTRTTTDRGYDANHRRIRTQLEPLVAAGTVICPRCNQPIQPGQPWDLGHTDDRHGYTGPEHRSCNRAAGARRNGGVTEDDAATRDSDVSARKTGFRVV